MTADNPNPRPDHTPSDPDLVERARRDRIFQEALRQTRISKGLDPETGKTKEAVA